MDDFIAQASDTSLVNKEGFSKTNPLVKFIIVIFVSLTLFFYLDLFKIYVVVFILILFFIFWPLPYDIAKPRYKMITTFSVTIFLIQILFNQNGDLLFHIINFKIANSGPFLPIYSQGVYQGLLLMGRFWGLISVSWIFVNSTNPFEFAHSLTKLKIPYRIAFTLSLALRFAPVFSSETQIIRNAQQARGLNIKSNNISGIKNILKFTLIPLIGSTLNRILGLTISMEGRAFGSYNKRSYVSEVPFTVNDFLKLLIIIAFLVILILL